LVDGFYDDLPEQLGLMEIHREATALATVARQNHLSLFSDMMLVASNVQNAEARQKMIKMLEEQWIIGLKKTREDQDKAEDRMLIDFAKQHMVIEHHGRELRARWANKPT
jgi:hypothetical protein